jgi:hypothetical protein
MSQNRFVQEEWKPVSFVGIRKAERYEVSNLGRLRWYNGTAEKWDIIKQYLGNGYYYAGFKIESTGKKSRSLKAVHRLVAEAFVEKPCANCRFVIHENYNLLDNRAANLAWVTRGDLTKHNKQNPRVKAALDKIKGKVTNSKLTETQVIRLKKKLKRSSNPLYKIAREFGITHTQLNRIRRGENWGHIEVE